MKKFNQACAEALVVINNSENSIKEKIPDEFVEYLEKQKDKSYTPNIDFNDPNWEDKLLEETLMIMGYIYREYIVSPEKRQEILQVEREEMSKIEQAKRKKYNPDELFKKEIKANSEQALNQPTTAKQQEELSLINKKETAYGKILKWLKECFRHAKK